MTTIKLKYTVDAIRRGNPPSYVENNGIPVVNQGCVWPSGLKKSKFKQHNPDNISRIDAWLQKGDILVNSTGTGTLGRVCHLDSHPETNIFADGHVTVLRDSNAKINTRLLFYVLSIQQERITVECSEGATNQIELSRSLLGQFKIDWPVFETQAKIADYLDRKTAELDQLIGEKKNLLKLLDEKKRGLIAHAVTRGLNPDAPLKETGIPWLGKIPQHWEVERVTTVFKERDQRGRPDLPLLVVSIHSGVTLRKFSDDKIEQQAADANTYKVALKGDIAFNKMRMWQGAVGCVPCDGLVSPDYVVASPNKGISPEYFGMLFKNPRFSDESACRSHGIVWDRLRLYWDEFKDICVPIPPLSEQKAIVTGIEKRLGKFDELKAVAENTIILLQERRTALISEAVTGKLVEAYA